MGATTTRMLLDHFGRLKQELDTARSAFREIGIGRRAADSLLLAGIRNPDDLRGLPDTVYAAIPGVGRSTLWAIESWKKPRGGVEPAYPELDGDA